MLQEDVLIRWIEELRHILFLRYIAHQEIVIWDLKFYYKKFNEIRL